LRGMGGGWHSLVGACRFGWLEVPGVSWVGSNLYLCGVPMKFDVLCGRERCLDLMLVLVTFLGFWAKKPGGVV